jgi:hypothetical protein
VKPQRVPRARKQARFYALRLAKKEMLRKRICGPPAVNQGCVLRGEQANKAVDGSKKNGKNPRNSHLLKQKYTKRLLK